MSAESSKAALTEGSTGELHALDHLPTHIVHLDRRGVIIAVNEEWRRFGTENGLQLADHGIGTDYCDLVARSLGPQHRLALDLRALLEGRSALLTWAYPCHAPDRKRWFNLIGVRLGDSHFARVALIHQEITALIPVDAAGPPPDTSRAALVPETHKLSEQVGFSSNSGLPEPTLVRSLSSRQRDVLGLLGQGLTNEEIANVLSVSPNTVKAYSSAIVTRLNLKNRTQAVLFAERLLKQDRARR